MPRYFTLSEARRHLPAIGSAMREGIDARKILEVAERDHRSQAERIMYSGGCAVNLEAAAQTRERRDLSSAKLKRIFESFEELGCIVKDLDIGLVDFPALYHGQEVYLCWRLGETDIRFWHGIDEGFAGRRAIDPDFLQECGGSDPS
jgi:hypothetical protein